MNLRPIIASGVVAASCCFVAGTAGPAAAVCDAYSGVCPTEAPPKGDGSTDKPAPAVKPATAVNPARVTKPAASQPDTLPVTGGELVLLTAVGVGVLAGGAALVVAGRRKKAPAA